ncbi:aspartic proteinase-like protein [Trifolium pratense]|uniref:Aspartic proteinase-like protein n=1 Tax=Trifolium pratense TaxID=57577 RepID=A0A2K3NFH3_TRIPR|nr:aspartic proteinase-like protein [Trifolium pratense]
MRQQTGEDPDPYFDFIEWFKFYFSVQFPLFNEKSNKSHMIELLKSLGAWRLVLWTSDTIQYGTGSVSGFFSYDNIKVGDIVVKDREFIDATSEPETTFVLATFDGLLGFGFQEISVGNIVQIWYNIVEQGLVKDLVFSFWLNRDPKTDEGGELVFDGLHVGYKERILAGCKVEIANLV